MSIYDPSSLLEELEIYQQRADAAVMGNLDTIEVCARDNPSKVLSSTQEAPKSIEIEVLDDIAPLSIESCEITYFLRSVNKEGWATYSIE